MEIPSFLSKSLTLYIAKIDLHLNYIFVNENFKTTFTHLTDINHFNAFSKANCENLTEAVSTYISNSGHDPLVIKLQHQKNNSQSIRIQWEFSYLKNKDSQIEGILCIGHDTSEEQINQSEEKFYSLFEQVSDAIMITDFEGNFTDINTSFCKMFGYSKQELLSMNIKELIDPEQLKIQPMLFNQLTKSQQVFSERMMLHKKGNIIEVEANAKKVDDNSIIAIAKDVTEIKNVKKQMQVTESMFIGAFEFSGIGMALVSLEGKWIKVNRQICNIIGYTEKELLSITFQDITHPDDLQKDLELLYKTISGEIESYKMEKRYFHKNGSVIWINLTVSLIRDTDNNPLYFVSQIEDINERKKATEALQKSEANIHTILDNTDIAYVLLDENLRVISFNIEAKKFATNELKLSGYEGIKIERLFPKYRREKLTKLLHDVIGGKHISYETKYPQADHSFHWYFVHFSPISNTENKIFGVMITFSNITEHKKVEKETLDHINLLEELSFVTSHELRYEYAKMQSAISFLKNIKSGEEEKNIIIDEIEKSFTSINNVIYKLNDKITFNQRSTNPEKHQTKFNAEKILLVDDDPFTSSIHKRVLQYVLNNKKEIISVSCVDDAIVYLKNNDQKGNHLIFLDLNMPEKNGWEFLENYKKFIVQSQVVILTSSIDPADIIRMGNYPFVRKFITKPLSVDFVKEMFSEKES